jgi:hypothetical protein
VIVIALVPAVVSWVWWIPNPSVESRSSGANALWLGHTWVGDVHSEADYAQLAEILRANQISDAYFHAGPIDGDGRIPADRYRHAPELLAMMHRFAPALHIQAYVGQMLARAGGPLDLQPAAVRDRILATARALLSLGFGGIHYDIEPVAAGDNDFLELLQHTHDLTKAQHAILSVSIPKLDPLPNGAQAMNGMLSRTGRFLPLATANFFQAIADRVDQVAVMVYDTPLPGAPLIGAVYAWETAQVLRLVGEQTTVFIGVPSYEEGPHLTGENLRTAIRGARRGIDQLGEKPGRPYGLAIFAEWTTSGREWSIWQKDWLSPGG